jgi:hypothetical protein
LERLLAIGQQRVALLRIELARMGEQGIEADVSCDEVD